MKHIILCTVLAATLSAAAQAPARRLSARSATLMEKKAHSDTVVGVYLDIDNNVFDTDALEALGIKAKVITDRYATARVPLSLLGTLAGTDGINYVHTASGATAMVDIARPATHITDVHAGTNMSQPYTGKGVVIGVVDAGFDYTHASFRDASGNLRIKRVWEQASQPTASNPAPEAFGYGLELSTAEAIESAGGDVKNNSHGTHVAALAAGSDRFMDGAYLGMAPDADIVLVSMGEASDDNVNISNAISYIFDYAESTGQPCVINLSLGSHGGPHDGTSAFDVIADALQGPGRLIVGSAGNHRSNLFHVSHTFSTSDEAPLRTILDLGTNLTKAVGGTVEFWGDGSGDFEVALCDYNTSRRTIEGRVVIYPSDSESPAAVSPGRNISGHFTVATEKSPLNGKHHAVITSEVKSIRANHAIAIEVTAKKAGQADVWADNTQIHLSDYAEDGFTGAGPFSSIAEIGGTAKRILSVGAYTTRNNYTLLNETETKTLDETMDSICSFSSCGPTADGRIKPQVAAPGCFIVSAVSQNDGSGTLQIAQTHSDGIREHLYGYMQGTSMSSPIVAGIVATWLQACPTLTPEQLEEVVAKTAVHPHSDTPDCDWGYGRIDAYSGIAECLAIGDAGVSSPVIDEGIAVRSVGETVEITFLDGYKDVEIGIYSTTGMVMAHKAMPEATGGHTVTLATSTLPHGVYILSISAHGGQLYTAKITR